MVFPSVIQCTFPWKLLGLISSSDGVIHFCSPCCTFLNIRHEWNIFRTVSESGVNYFFKGKRCRKYIVVFISWKSMWNQGQTPGLRMMSLSWYQLSEPEGGFHTSKTEPVWLGQIPGVVQSVWPSTQLPGGGHIWWVTATPWWRRGPTPAARLCCRTFSSAWIHPPQHSKAFLCLLQCYGVSTGLYERTKSFM